MVDFFQEHTWHWLITVSPVSSMRYRKPVDLCNRNLIHFCINDTRRSWVNTSPLQCQLNNASSMNCESNEVSMESATLCTQHVGSTKAFRVKWRPDESDEKTIWQKGGERCNSKSSRPYTVLRYCSKEISTNRAKSVIRYIYIYIFFITQI
jgi:hypothetical protein